MPTPYFSILGVENLDHAAAAARAARIARAIDCSPT